VYTLVRLAISAFIIFGVYKETGIYTATAIFLIVASFEIMAISIELLLKKLK